MLKAIIAAYKNHSTYRATYNELSRLSNKELYDIGIVNDEILKKKQIDIDNKKVNPVVNEKVKIDKTKKNEILIR